MSYRAPLTGWGRLQLLEVGQKIAIYVPAGVAHSVKNDSGSNLTLLVMMTPHPNYAK